MFEQKEHAFKQFNKDFKDGNINNVIVFYGVEDYLIEWACNQIIDKYVNHDMIEMDLDKVDEFREVHDIIDSCNTFSMVSEKRVVWVKNFQYLKNQKSKGYTLDDADIILNYAKMPNDGTILILSNDEIDSKSNFIKELTKLAPFYNFEPLDEPSLLGFSEKRFKLENVNISKDMLKLFVSETGYFNKESEYRIFNIVNDIKKIASHCENNEVKEEDIISTLSGDLETFIFDFLENISTNKKEAAFRMLHNILSSGNDVFKVLGTLINHFELILSVKEFKDEGMSLNILKEKLKIHEFRIKKAMVTADRFDRDKLKNILISLYEVDRKVKLGEMDAVLALELIVGNI